MISHAAALPAQVLMPSIVWRKRSLFMSGLSQKESRTMEQLANLKYARSTMYVANGANCG